MAFFVLSCLNTTGVSRLHVICPIDIVHFPSPNQIRDSSWLYLLTSSIYSACWELPINSTWQPAHADGTRLLSTSDPGNVIVVPQADIDTDVIIQPGLGINANYTIGDLHTFLLCCFAQSLLFPNSSAPSCHRLVINTWTFAWPKDHGYSRISSAIKMLQHASFRTIMPSTIKSPL